MVLRKETSSSVSRKLLQIPRSFLLLSLTIIIVFFVVNVTAAVAAGVDDGDDLVTYVLEPFESSFQDDEAVLRDLYYWIEEGQAQQQEGGGDGEEDQGCSLSSSSSMLRISLTEQPQQQESSPSSLAAAAVGKRALQVSYAIDNNDVHDNESKTVLVVESVLDGSRVHNVDGSTYASFWYRSQKTGSDGNNSNKVDLKFYWLTTTNQGEGIDDEDEFTTWWQYHETFDTGSSSSDDEWKQLKLFMDPSHWKMMTTTTKTTTNDDSDGHRRRLQNTTTHSSSSMMIDLTRIKGWRIELLPKSSSTTTFATSSSSSSNRNSNMWWFDHICFHGSKSLFGSIFHTDTWDEALHRQTIHPIYHNSELSKVNSTQLIGNGTFTMNYLVQQREVWGGFIQYQHITPGRSYYDLSSLHSIALDYHVLNKSSLPSRVHLRILLLDSSDCIEACSEYNGPNLENYYSFHYILDDVENEDMKKKTIDVELLGDDRSDSPFYRTGWYGIIGNNVLDKSMIKGIKFEVSIDSQGEIDSFAKGSVELSNLRAVETGSSSSSASKVSGYDYESSSSQCVVELELQLSNKLDPSIFRKIEFMSNTDACCQACQDVESCHYAMTDHFHCYLAEDVPQENVSLLAHERVEKTLTVFWKNTIKSRGDFCAVCTCDESQQKIDCRGRDLVVAPMRYDLTWTPRVLDLRDNPRLVILGSDALDDLAPYLESLLVPSNISYVAPKSIANMPYLREIVFQQDEQSPRLDEVDGRLQTALINAIADPSDAYGDVCCSQGDYVGFASPSPGLTYCDMKVDRPGADAIYEDFVNYIDAEKLMLIRESSSYLSEAAESVEKCAAYCDLLDECMYFSYDNRITLTEKECSLLKDNRNPNTVCCYHEHYADKNQTIPGYVSGYVPRTRCSVDNARVYVEGLDGSSGSLELGESNDYRGFYQVRLGSKPTRGGVWVTPRSGTIGMKLGFTPPRVVLYDNETVATVIVTAEGRPENVKVMVHNDVESCDRSFATQGSCVQADDLAIYISIVVPWWKMSTPAVAVIFVTLGISMMIAFYACLKRGQEDSMWHIHPSELRFAKPPEVIGRGTFGLVLLAEYRGTQVAVKRMMPPLVGDLKRDAASSEYLPSFGEPAFAASESLDMEAGHATSRGMSDGVSRFYEKPLALKAGDYSALKASFINEMRCLSNLQHPCIVTVMGAVNSRNTEPMLVMEYMDHGSLYDVLHNETFVLIGEHILPILRDIASGVRFLHSASPQIVHGDLKAANILVDSRFRAKVADFGLSQRKHLRASGSPYWMAPELLRGESANSTMSDAYAFAIVMYEIFSRKDPYEGEEFEVVMQQVANPLFRKRPPVPSTCPLELQTIMVDSWDECPRKRPSFMKLDHRLKELDAVKIGPSMSQLSYQNNRRNYKESDDILDDVFPVHVADALRRGVDIEPEFHDVVTIFFSDIVNFTTISQTLSPIKVSALLDRLYKKFDALSQEHEVFKVETIGDSWMGVTNLIHPQSDHTKRIARFAIDVHKAAHETWIDVDRKDDLGRVKVRIGFHSGPVVANVVGSRNPRYCLFGDTVNTASRMESHSISGRIHCSQSSATLLRKQDSKIIIVARGKIEVKGKGSMHTFWVSSESDPPDPEMGLSCPLPPANEGFTPVASPILIAEPPSDRVDNYGDTASDTSEISA